ncbi:prepilin peptidase [Brevibacterium album]|uniref:prepilin peptidase n=1 Tax=Brevibacterium album TaxID=417948 RepID=UPI0004013A36|nr:prepilin peptidase [Brevibacterium album]
MILLWAGLTAAAVSGLLALRLPWLLADEAGMRLLRRHRSLPVLALCAGPCLAVFAAACWPVPLTPLLACALGAQAAAAPVLAVVDVRIRRLPDRIVLPLSGLTLALLGAQALLDAPASAGSPALTALLTGAAGSAVLLLLSLAGGRGRGLALGLGDVKVAFCVGAVAGLVSPLTAVGAFLAANLTGLLEAGVRTALLRQPLTTRFALGPHLLLGMWAVPLAVSALR